MPAQALARKPSSWPDPECVCGVMSADEVTNPRVGALLRANTKVFTKLRIHIDLESRPDLSYFDRARKGVTVSPNAWPQSMVDSWFASGEAALDFAFVRRGKPS